MTPELDERLRALGAEIDWPRTPSLTVDLPTRTRPSAVLVRPAFGAAVAIVLVLVALIAAVPDVRAEVLRWFGLGAVQIRVVEELPLLADDLNLGKPVTRAQARRTRLPIPASAQLGRPGLYASRSAPGGILTARWHDRHGATLLVSVVRGDGLAFAKKVIRGSDRVAYTRIPGWDDGLWIERFHAVAFIDARGEFREERSRLSASTLIWNDGPLTYRLETSLPLPEALGVAGSLR